MTVKKTLIISTNYGTEADELTKPIEAMQAAGFETTVATPNGGTIQTLKSDKELGPEVAADAKLADVDPTEFAAVVIPGGTLNADTLRMDKDAQRVVKGIADAGKTVAAICHGPWLLINSGLAKGKMLTSYPSLELDLTNAGADWADEEVRICQHGGYTLITSRNPGDLPAFNKAITDELA
ncbi:type 1 glutamine amidotransferase domain-containing protein [Corynebacterium ulceribovis]|uniref:type 1 glutamine amidotransferase domain-containing protein n=1 Tax=Corynebacterium ulceribovis TaxID=487732 RepID=UPI00036E7280|nr:type 1 glutamine amidotransferase domain-containing protein [Corynebacterium ulceribovis]